MTAQPTYLTTDALAFHEAAHAAAMMLGNPPLIPTELRIDYPTATTGEPLAGVVRLQWGADGITRGKAKVALCATIVGARTEPGGDWTRWPLDTDEFPHECSADIKKCSALAAYIGVESRAEWCWHVHLAQRMWERPDFRRLLMRITAALETTEVLDKQALIDLLEEDQWST
jgi:hypothetical protein